MSCIWAFVASLQRGDWITLVSTCIAVGISVGFAWLIYKWQKKENAAEMVPAVTSTGDESLTVLNSVPNAAFTDVNANEINLGTKVIHQVASPRNELAELLNKLERLMQTIGYCELNYKHDDFAVALSEAKEKATLLLGTKHKELGEKSRGFVGRWSGIRTRKGSDLQIAKEEAKAELCELIEKVADHLGRDE